MIKFLYEVYNSKNELVLQSESLAFFIDMIKVKPSTIPDYYYDKYKIYEEDKVYVRNIILDDNNNEMLLLESHWIKNYLLR